VSDDGESSQLAGIGIQATLTSAQPARLRRWSPQRAGFIARPFYLQSGNDAVMARFSAWLALAEA